MQLRDRLRAVVTFPPLVGALYMLVRVGLAASARSEQDRALGESERARAVEIFVTHRYDAEITRLALSLGCIAAAIGLALGLVAAALMRVRSPQRARGVWGLAEPWLVVAALHAAIMAWAVAQAPQLYAASLYSRGGVWRALQVVVTDTLGPWGVALMSLVLGAFYTRIWKHFGSGGPLTWLAHLRGMQRRVAGAGLGALLFLVAYASQRHAHAGDAGAPSAAKAPNAPRAAGGKKTNVLVLAADSLRADRLVPRTMPEMSAFVEHGAVFERAYVSLPRTFSSWVTLLTGRYAFHHGVRSMFPRWEDRQTDFNALPAQLAAAGYRTGVVSDFAGDIFGRIDLGFDTVDTPRFDLLELVRQRALERETPLLPFLHSRRGRTLFPTLREMNHAADPDMLAKDVVDAVDAMQGGPFFLTAFFSTAHFPYAAPHPYYGRFTDPSYRGAYKYHKPVGLEDEAVVAPADVQQIRALYDGSVLAIDHAMGRVVDALRDRGLLQNTIVVITADHGETLYENDHGAGHGDHLFGDEGTHTPLAIVVPGRSRQREAGIVRDVDLAPTLYDLTGVEAPARLDGRSLASRLEGKPLDARLAFAETELWFTESIPGLPATLRLPYPGVMHLTEPDAEHGDEIVLRKSWEAVTTTARHRMVRDARWKLVYVPTREGAKLVLFDTLNDPGETRDVSLVEPKEQGRLKKELYAWMLSDERAEMDGQLVVTRPKSDKVEKKAAAAPTGAPK